MPYLTAEMADRVCGSYRDFGVYVMIACEIKGYRFQFKTNANCFSPNAVDRGTLAMLNHIAFKENDRMIDLGCGYGVMGIAAAKFTKPGNVYMLDISSDAVECAKENAVLNNVSGVTIIQSDGFSGLSETGFDLILSNPPYHTDFAVPKMFIEKGFNRLKTGGKMLLVTKRKTWYQNKMTAIFGGVKVSEADGYFIFESEKRSARYANK